jgi:hypothetical protein
MIRIFAIFMILASLSCQTQDKKRKEEKDSKKDLKITNKSVLILRDTIAQINEVQDSHIGVAGSLSAQYGNYKNLLDIASDNDLLLLTKDTNYCVVTYATFGLIERNNPTFIDVFECFLEDDKMVKTMKGCMVGFDLVSSEIYHEYWNKLRLESDNEIIALQNDKILLKLDSLIIVSDTAEWLLYDRAYNNRIFGDEYSSLIQSHAFERKNIYAIEYLFKNNLVEYQQKIIVTLKEYLNKEEIWPIYYDKIFTMLLSFKQDELNQLLVLELKDIKEQYGESKLNKYKYILSKNGVKI